MSTLGRGAITLRGAGVHGAGFLLTIPMIIGSLIGGYIYSLSPTYPWFLSTAILFVCLLLIIRLVKEPEKPEL